MKRGLLELFLFLFSQKESPQAISISKWETNSLSDLMKSLRQRPTVLKEHAMKRPDLDTLACVRHECQYFRRAGQAGEWCFAKRYIAMRGEYKIGRGFDHYSVWGTSSILHGYRLYYWGVHYMASNWDIIVEYLEYSAVVFLRVPHEFSSRHGRLLLGE